MQKIVLIFFLIISLNAGVRFTYPDFSKCFQSVSTSFIYISGIKFFPYDKHYLISVQNKNSKVCDLYDEFTKVCLKKRVTNKYFKKCKPIKLSNFLATIDEDKVFVSNFAKQNSMILEFNTLQDSFSGGIVVNDCCEIVGLGSGKNKFIPHKYIQHLKAKKSGIYTTLGFSVKKHFGKIVVDKVMSSAVDLKSGDVIIAIDNKKIKSVYDFNDYSLFLKTNKVYSVYCENEKVTFVKAKLLKTSKLLYLSSEKAWINENLLVVKTNNYLRNIGDKLITVDAKEVKRYGEVLRYKNNNSIYKFEKSKKNEKNIAMEVDKNSFWIEKRK